jgi:hypothetical protein
MQARIQTSICARACADNSTSNITAYVRNIGAPRAKNIMKNLIHSNIDFMNGEYSIHWILLKRQKTNPTKL